MAKYGSKVVAVLDTESAFGVEIKGMRDNISTLQAGQVQCATLQPQNPSEGQLWFDKVNLQLKIYVSDGNSSQWVEV